MKERKKGRAGYGYLNRENSEVVDGMEDWFLEKKGKGFYRVVDWIGDWDGVGYWVGYEKWEKYWCWLVLIFDVDTEFVWLIFEGWDSNGIKVVGLRGRKRKIGRK